VETDVGGVVCITASFSRLAATAGQPAEPYRDKATAATRLQEKSHRGRVFAQLDCRNVHSRRSAHLMVAVGAKSAVEAQASVWLRAHSMRLTAPRVAVLSLLATQNRPMSHAEVVRALGSTPCDPVTIYRTLVRLAEVGITRIATRTGGKIRYELAVDTSGLREDHAHFVCTQCGMVACLPAHAIVRHAALEAAWRDAVVDASVQLEGCCPSCARDQSPVGKRNAKTESGAAE
jgi:Fur family transcriptional regulator, ferric uptake regulator